MVFFSENIFKIYTKPEYAWIKNNFTIHTLSDTEIFGERNILIFTPERYLSFLDKNNELNLDFVFVDEVYKLDNGFIIDETPQENERDVAYRIALYELLKVDTTDALLVGPYIVFPDIADANKQSSFQIFLDRKARLCYYISRSLCRTACTKKKPQRIRTCARSSAG